MCCSLPDCLSVMGMCSLALQPSMLKFKNPSASATHFKSNISLLDVPTEDIQITKFILPRKKNLLFVGTEKEVTILVSGQNVCGFFTSICYNLFGFFKMLFFLKGWIKVSGLRQWFVGVVWDALWGSVQLKHWLVQLATWNSRAGVEANTLCHVMEANTCLMFMSGLKKHGLKI